MLRDRRRQARLLETFWAALRRDRHATPPEGLDPQIAAVVTRLEHGLAAPAPSAAFAARLQRQIEARITEPASGAWTTPALDTRRRPAPPTQPATETVKEPPMSELTEIPGEYPVDIRQRRRLREWVKLAAAALVIFVLGAVLTLVFRGDDEEQVAVPAPTPTATPSPTTTATPAATATAAAIEPAPTVAPSPTATLPPAGQVVATIPVGDGPGEMAVGAGSIWVVNSGDGSLSRIDPATNAVTATIPVGSPATDTLFIFVRSNGEQVWVLNLVDETLQRIDPATNQVAATLPRPDLPGVLTLPYGPFAVADDGALWLAYEQNGWVARVDPVTGQITAALEVDEPSVATAAGAVWVIGTGDRTVLRLDPATAEVVATIEMDGTPRRIAETAGAVWVGLWSGVGLVEDGRVLRIDPTTNEVVAEVTIATSNPFEMAAGPTGVWAIDFRAGRLYQIDQSTNELVGTMGVPPGIGITESDGSVWVSAIDQDAVQRIDPAP
jgi:YVTN family beta-propeller protein